MRADKSRDDGSNIPYGGISVNAVLCEALSGTAGSVISCGVDVPRGASVADLTGMCCRLIRLGTKMSVTVQFCIGDVYRCAPPYSKARQSLYEAVEKQFGTAVAERLREFGRVASAWPVVRRNPDVCWAYYRTHRPGVPGKADVKTERKEVELTLLSAEMVDGVLVEHWTTPSGTRCVTRKCVNADDS